MKQFNTSDYTKKSFSFPTYMKAQEKEEKDNIKLRYAVGLYKALKESPLQSFRKLAEKAGMEPAHIQKISVGKLDVTLTTNIAIANAFGISYSALSYYYDNVTEGDTQEFVRYLEKQKKLKGNRDNRSKDISVHNSQNSQKKK